MSLFYLYAVTCSDDSIYCGISTDVKRRVREHNESPRGSKYCLARRPVELLAWHPIGTQGPAQSAEAAFKRLSREKKLEAVKQWRWPR